LKLSFFNPLGNSIETGEITDGTIIDADIAPSAQIAESKILFSPAGHDHSGTTNGNPLPPTGIENGAILDQHVLGGPLFGITEAKLLFDNSAGHDHDGSNSKAVDYSDIANKDIVNADVNASAGIVGSKLADNSIPNAKLVNSTIDSTKIATLGIARANLSNGIVDGSKLNTGAVSTPKLDYNGSGAPGSGDKGKAIIVSESDESLFDYVDFPAGGAGFLQPNLVAGTGTPNSWTINPYYDLGAAGNTYAGYSCVAKDLDFSAQRTLKIRFAWGANESSDRSCRVAIDARAIDEDMSGTSGNISDGNQTFGAGNAGIQKEVSISIGAGAITEGDRISIRIWRYNTTPALDGSAGLRILDVIID